MINVAEAKLVADDQTYWRCTAQDAHQHTWVIQHEYLKMALNQAIELCKKTSPAPKTCIADEQTCSIFTPNQPHRTLWECTALDDNGRSWTSKGRHQRDEAATTAESYCKQQSKIPETCYINLITCKKN